MVPWVLADTGVWTQQSPCRGLDKRSQVRRPVETYRGGPTSTVGTLWYSTVSMSPSQACIKRYSCLQCWIALESCQVVSCRQISRPGSTHTLWWSKFHWSFNHVFFRCVIVIPPIMRFKFKVTPHCDFIHQFSSSPQHVLGAVNSDIIWHHLIIPSPNPKSEISQELAIHFWAGIIWAD